MKIFDDIFTEIAVLTDSYPMDILHDVFYEVKGTMLAQTNEIDGSLISGKPQEPEGEVEPMKVLQCDVVSSNCLVQLEDCEEKSIQNSVKIYLQKLIDHLKQTNPERAEIVEANASKAFSEVVLKNFEEFRFYAGETDRFDNEGMIIFMRSDPAHPPETKQLLYFWKDGLIGYRG